MLAKQTAYEHVHFGIMGMSLGEGHPAWLRPIAGWLQS